MSDLTEEPGCYQCGSFEGTTFRLCASCRESNERERDERRHRIASKPRLSESLGSSRNRKALVATIFWLGFTAVVLVYVAKQLGA